MAANGPFDKRIAGQSFNPFAVEHNAFIDAALEHRKRPKEGPAVLPDDTRASVVRVRNDSGVELEQFSVVGVGAPLIKPAENLKEFKREMTFKVTTPEALVHEGFWAVTLEPLGIGKTGFAVVAGVVIAKLRVAVGGTVTYFAEMLDGEHVLDNVSEANGTARVLWADTEAMQDPEETEDEYDDIWCYVRIEKGGGAAAGAFLVKLTDATYTPGEFTEYTGSYLTDGVTPVPVGYAVGDEVEFPIYHEENVDIPVPAVVRVRMGDGAWGLFDQMPRMEPVRKTGIPVDVGGFTYIPGELVRYNRTTKGLTAVEDCLIRDLNNL